MTATTEHAADGRRYDQRDYVDRTIATIRQHEPNALRENWWTGAALALADEVDRLRSERAPGPMPNRCANPECGTIQYGVGYKVCPGCGSAPA